MEKKRMSGFDAVGYMLIEEGRIVAVRNERLWLRFDHEAILKNGFPRVNVAALNADGYEIGWRCTKCEGSGEISVPCKCSGRSLASLQENPCCDGWDTAKCPKCTEGLSWQKEY